MMDEDLIGLLSAWRGGDIDPEESNRLLSRLAADEAFGQAFVDEIRMLGMLKAVQSTEPRWLPLHEEVGWGDSGLAPERWMKTSSCRESWSVPPRVSSPLRPHSCDRHRAPGGGIGGILVGPTPQKPTGLDRPPAASSGSRTSSRWS